MQDDLNLHGVLGGLSPVAVEWTNPHGYNDSVAASVVSRRLSLERGALIGYPAGSAALRHELTRVLREAERGPAGRSRPSLLANLEWVRILRHTLVLTCPD